MKTEIAVLDQKAMRAVELLLRAVNDLQNQIHLAQHGMVREVSDAYWSKHGDRRGAIERARQADFGRPLLERLRKAQDPATKDELGLIILRLVGGFANVSKMDVGLFAKTMVEQIEAKEPGCAPVSKYALAAACSHLLNTARFVPAIAELREAIKAAESYLQAHISGLERVPAKCEEIEQQLQAEERLPRRLAG